MYPPIFSLVFLSWLDDLIKKGHGLLVFYSLKNSAFPEYIYPTTSNILCLDIHEKHSHLVVVGFCDGCVAVYNLKEKRHEPVYKSTAKTGKHTDPVWQVTTGGIEEMDRVFGLHDVCLSAEISFTSPLITFCPFNFFHDL